MIAREGLDKILAEQALQQSGCVSDECAVQVGRLLNVRKIIMGSINYAFDVYSVIVRIVDVESGATEYSFTREAIEKKQIITSFPESISRDIIAKYFDTAPAGIAAPDLTVPIEEIFAGLPDNENDLAAFQKGTGYLQKLSTAYEAVKNLHSDASVTDRDKVKYYRLFVSAFTKNNPYLSEVRQYIKKAKLFSGIEDNMVFIPSGSFLMGNSLTGGDRDEEPAHIVDQSSFYISKYEVTFDDYDIFCEKADLPLLSDMGWGRAQRPAINVSWQDAADYCNWLSGELGLEKAYDSDYGLHPDKNGYRLPTEAEWEKASRGKLVGNRYPWGDQELDNFARYNKFLFGSTFLVGVYPPNDFGLYDMAGNVWEWCDDWYQADYYETSPGSNPAGPGSGVFKIIRGGSFVLGASSMRCANRHFVIQSYSSADVGFRIARNATGGK